MRGKQGGHSTLGRPDLHQNTRMKSQLLSEIFRPAGTKPHITHRELHLVLSLGTADVAKSFPHHNSFHIVFSVPAEKSGLLWEARKSAKHHPSSAFS